MHAFGLALSSLALVVSLPSEMPQRQRDELLQGCTNALLPEKCTEASESQRPEAWVELIDTSRVGLEVELRSATSRGRASREMTFDAADDEVDRARATGLSLGLMARSLRADESETRPGPPTTPEGSSPPAGPPEEPPASEGDPSGSRTLAQEKAVRARPRTRSGPSPRPRASRRPLILGVEGGALHDPGLASWEGGGGLHVESLFAPPFGMWASVEMHAGLSTDGTISVRRIAPAAGIELLAVLGRVEIVGQVDMGVENLHVRIASALGPAARWVGFVRVGTALRVPARSALQMSLTPRLRFLPGTTEVLLDDRPTVTSSRFVPSLDLGLRWTPWF